MYHNTPLFVVSLLLQLCQCAIERDLLLTPKEGLHIHGRTLHYDPPGNQTNGITPWEQTLKHVTYLTLFSEEGGLSSSLSDLEEYKKFMHSPYIRIHEEYPKFGDIITMARGRLEKSNGYRFIEGACEPHCSNAVVALWRVQKIRHRDPQRGFRYEMKFSVTPAEGASARQNKQHPLGEQYFKSFILKDDDYPESFSALTRRSDSLENFSNERQARIVNEIPRKKNPNALLSHVPPLNIGEYFKEIPKASSKVGYIQSARPVFPTTYRPNYHMKFNKPEVFETPEEPKTVVTHHFHHHYFMKDADDSSHHDQSLFLGGNSDAIRIIEAPHAELLPSQYTVTPYTTTTTTTTPPPAIFYMQQIPLYIQSFPQEETITRQVDPKPFRQSEQQIEEIRYSDPDPLYENINDQLGSSQSASAEIHPQVERPIGRGTHTIPQSISTEQPPPSEDQDTQVPYVEDEEDEEEEEEVTTTIRPTTTPSPPVTRRTLPTKPRNIISTSTSENALKYASKLSLQKHRSYPRTTTEQPVLRWKPKRKPKQKAPVEEPDSSTAQSSTEETVITVTPSRVDVADIEILTQKSVSKSISVKVGNHSEEIPLESATLGQSSTEKTSES